MALCEDLGVDLLEPAENGKTAVHYAAQRGQPFGSTSLLARHTQERGASLSTPKLQYKAPGPHREHLEAVLHNCQIRSPGERRSQAEASWRIHLSARGLTWRLDVQGALLLSC